MNDQRPLILYDPDCPLCLRFKQGLEYLDKTLLFMSARDDQIYIQHPQLIREECLEKVHMLLSDGRVLKGNEVVEHLLETLPGVSKLSWLLDNDQGRKVKDFFYQKVEELRILSQKKKSDCNECPTK